MRFTNPDMRELARRAKILTQVYAHLARHITEKGNSMNRIDSLPVRTGLGLLTRIILLSLSMTGLAAAQDSQSAVSFDYPGATNTQATAITPSGAIVGRYNSSDGVLHGFLLARGHFFSIDYPGAVYTDVTWINPGGEIGGGYGDVAGTLHGFVLRNGQFTRIDYPGAATSTVYGISAAGELIGVWTSTQNVLEGYLEKDGHFTDVVFPGATSTLPAMLADGILMGGYFIGPRAYGFEIVEGIYKTIDCPGATWTFLSGIDPEGNMVGGFGTADGYSHGALIRHGICSAIDYPGGHDTYANGSNPEGDVVGRYTDQGGVTHGFLLRHYIRTGK